MAKRSNSEPKAHPGPLVVCKGGPWDGRWYTEKAWNDRRNAASNMGYEPSSLPGAALAYVKTNDVVAHPEEAWTGAVWRWHPPRPAKEPAGG